MTPSRRGFFRGVTFFDPPAKLACYAGPLLIARGTKDTTVPPAAVDTFLAAHEGDKTKWTAKMDHVFKAFTGPETVARWSAKPSPS